MREILFKAKRLNNDEWVEGSLLEQIQDNRGCNYYVEEARVIEHRYYIAEKEVSEHWEGFGMGEHTVTDQQKYLVDPETVCQYTGLKDSNGNRVFEGDIVRYADRLDYGCYTESIENPAEYEGCNYSDIFTTDKVVYGIKHDYPAFDLHDHDFECNALSELNNGDWHYEVIGNIFDNPELLEVGK